ncbi:hypothetical protein HU200_043039 [Digitaria exilis]|uniref:Uncharacterized protein n=1 Tax=Digitaria exilis TaxID=1010633 RepID=A0A835EGN8_9POAL|nr:hypothetical protein HU200_043039 [Digitaria exilis]
MPATRHCQLDDPCEKKRKEHTKHRTHVRNLCSRTCVTCQPGQTEEAGAKSLKARRPLSFISHPTFFFASLELFFAHRFLQSLASEASRSINHHDEAGHEQWRCGAAATVGTPAPGKTITEEQARDIMSAAQRAVEEAKRGDAEGMSLKKSLEWFLEGRKNKAAMATGETQRHIIDDSCSSPGRSKLRAPCRPTKQPGQGTLDEVAWSMEVASRLRFPASRTASSSPSQCPSLMPLSERVGRADRRATTPAGHCRSCPLFLSGGEGDGGSGRAGESLSPCRCDQAIAPRAAPVVPRQYVMYVRIALSSSLCF